MTKEIQLVYFEQCEQIRRFDILVSDPHAGCERRALPSTTNLTLQEVWEWLCEGGEWSYKVTAHGQPDKVFMSGLTYINALKHAYEGSSAVHLCFATEEEAEEFKEKTFSRLRKEMHIE
jgi:hypothetical protein